MNIKRLDCLFCLRLNAVLKEFIWVVNFLKIERDGCRFWKLGGGDPPGLKKAIDCLFASGVSRERLPRFIFLLCLLSLECVFSVFEPGVVDDAQIFMFGLLRND
jgi:hypothetical protein